MKADRQLAQVYAGIWKTTGTKQEGKAAVTLQLIRRMVDIVESVPMTASRDRVMILIGLVGGLRRSELAAIRCEHLQPDARGITITLRIEVGLENGQLQSLPLAFAR